MVEVIHLKLNKMTMGEVKKQTTNQTVSKEKEKGQGGGWKTLRAPASPCAEGGPASPGGMSTTGTPVKPGHPKEYRLREHESF